MSFTLEFDGDLTYSTDGPAMVIGTGLGFGNPEGYHIADGMVVIDFGSGVFHKIPERFLRRILEWNT